VLLLLLQVIKVSHLGPSSAHEWQQEGRVHFTAQDYSQASHCYTSALKMMLEEPKQTSSSSRSPSNKLYSSTSTTSPRNKATTTTTSSQVQGPCENGSLKILLSLLLNLSAVKLKLQDPASALVYAAAALCLDPTCVKAAYREALALAAGGQDEAGRALMEIAADIQEQQEVGPGVRGQGQKQAQAARDKFMTELKAAAATAAAVARAGAGRGRGGARRGGGRGGEGALEVQGWSKEKQKEAEVAALQATARAVNGFLQQQQEQEGREVGSSSSGKDKSCVGSINNSDGQGRKTGEAAELKERGNAAFQSGDYTAAAAAYAAALAAESAAAATAATLLSNKAACALALGTDHLQNAVADATAAVVLNPGLVKGHYRRCKGLLQLGFLAEAREACGLGLRLDPEEKALLQLKERLEILAAHQPDGDPSDAATAAGAAAAIAACAADGDATLLVSAATGGAAAGRGATTGDGCVATAAEKHAGMTGNTAGNGSGPGAKKKKGGGTRAAAKSSKGDTSSSTCSGSGGSQSVGGTGPARDEKSDASALKGSSSRGRSSTTTSSSAAGKEQECSRSISEKEFKELEQEGSMGLAQMAAHNDSMVMRMRLGRPRGPALPSWMVLVYERVPKFHDEFSKQGRWVL
jgi:hypothetical protein